MLILVGHSESGKTEIANQLKTDYNMKKIITYTTRPKRINEVDGVDYHFVDQEKFLKLKEEGIFVETTCFNGFYYGSSKNDVKDDSVVILDPVGLEKLKNSNLDNIVAIFLNCDEEIRYKRMIARGDEEKLAKEQNANYVCFGHTHSQYLEEYEGVYFINPGALKSGNYALITLDEISLK